MIELEHQSPVPFLPIYLNEDELFCIVDEIDHAWASQWLWRPKFDKHQRKIYATRSHDIRRDGRRILSVTLYLHKEICRRTHGPPPSPKMSIGDHKDGKSLNCRRGNMRWATSKMNRQNIDGWFARQHALEFSKEMTT